MVGFAASAQDTVTGSVFASLRRLSTPPRYKGSCSHIAHTISVRGRQREENTGSPPPSILPPQPIPSTSYSVFFGLVGAVLTIKTPMDSHAPGRSLKIREIPWHQAIELC